MFLLILTRSVDNHLIFAFTFQYVSINTEEAEESGVPIVTLHSNMFLLIRTAGSRCLSTQVHFTFQYVSINTTQTVTFRNCKFTLHSNMFLLIWVNVATLDNIGVTLHSNMFLLIHKAIQILVASFFFTFQYVSINTQIVYMVLLTMFPLHSNMFLLIHRRYRKR